MTPPAKTARANGSTLPWSQTSFLAVDTVITAPTVPYDDASWEVMEALRAADQAVDAHSQRRALERLARHLSQQAQQRGRTPVPKRPS